MNLYKLHKSPKSLLHYERANDSVPSLFWEKYEHYNHAELRKREIVIAEDPKYAYEYAKKILRGPFPRGEAAIAKDPSTSYQYATYVLKGRFPKGEAAIAQSAPDAFLYARDVLKQRWHAAEPTIAKDSFYAYWYAHDIIKGPWPAGEPAIAQMYGDKYAKSVLKDNFYLDGKLIATNS